MLEKIWVSLFRKKLDLLQNDILSSQKLYHSWPRIREKSIFDVFIIIITNRYCFCFWSIHVKFISLIHVAFTLVTFFPKTFLFSYCVLYSSKEAPFWVGWQFWNAIIGFWMFLPFAMWNFFLFGQLEFLVFWIWGGEFWHNLDHQQVINHGRIYISMQRRSRSDYKFLIQYFIVGCCPENKNIFLLCYRLKNNIHFLKNEICLLMSFGNCFWMVISMANIIYYS